MKDANDKLVKDVESGKNVDIENVDQEQEQVIEMVFCKKIRFSFCKRIWIWEYLTFKKLHPTLNACLVH